MGYTMDYPWFINAPMIFAWFAFLTITTFLASLFVFRKKDI
jgi:ABC-type transport system involved in multi-copper enzyme maturation permease subunit